MSHEREQDRTAGGECEHIETNAPSSYRSDVSMLDDLLEIELGHEHSKLKPRMTARIIAAAVAIALYKTAKPNYQVHGR
ncbi:hypothetical protein [Lacticaseibacillus yichunensis]|uniref:Uncharacterized protein n=1 Tax=Lacticaseibacillus yichunensis TaxID=2486015 RepID=A0ABW4CKX9_9LACO|nr:hypothetical protein [Lacticaseibacillus yichunensis]